MSQTLIIPRRTAPVDPKRVKCGDCNHLQPEGAVGEFVCVESPPQVTVILTPMPPPHVGKLAPQPFCTYPPRFRDSLGCGKFKAKLVQ